MSNSSKFVCELSTSKNAHWSESNAVINWTTTEVYRNRNGDSSFNRKCQRATFPDRHAWFGHLFKSIRFNWKYYCRKFWVRVYTYFIYIRTKAHFIKENRQMKKCQWDRNGQRPVFWRIFTGPSPLRKMLEIVTYVAQNNFE